VHVLYVSIVGVDRSSLPYYRAKRAAEQHVQASDAAWDILRATQFHRFALSVLQSLTGHSGTLTVPAGTFLQPIAVDEVAERLVTIARGERAGASRSSAARRYSAWKRCPVPASEVPAAKQSSAPGRQETRCPTPGARAGNFPLSMSKAG
jgi:uncharacterized protein YbjT (DUF2867 family)